MLKAFQLVDIKNATTVRCVIFRMPFYLLQQTINNEVQSMRKGWKALHYVVQALHNGNSFSGSLTALSSKEKKYYVHHLIFLKFAWKALLKCTFLHILVCRTAKWQLHKNQNSFTVKIPGLSKWASQILSTKIQIYRKEQDSEIGQFQHWGPQLIKP